MNCAAWVPRRPPGLAAAILGGIGLLGPARRDAGSPQLKVQLNLRDTGERIRLLPVATNPDGTPSVFRITDGQVATFTTTFNY